MGKIEIIGIDHGWSQIKTSNYCFNTSIKELPNVPAFTDNVLCTEFGIKLVIPKNMLYRILITAQYCWAFVF